MYIKEFDKWNEVKKDAHSQANKINIRAGEVRWMICGVNIGSEIDGKGVSFTRPALILHVIGSNLALAIPLSTQIKKVAGYYPFRFQEKQVSLCIHQIRIVSRYRILSRMGKISDTRLEEIKKEIKQFFSLG